jgi:hypothetical protein
MAKVIREASLTETDAASQVERLGKMLKSATTWNYPKVNIKSIGAGLL